MCNCVNININPVRDYRPVENRCHKTSNAVRYATCMLQYGDAFHTECRGHVIYNFLPGDTFLRNVLLITTLF